MRVIEQEQFVELSLSGNKAIKIEQCGDFVWIDKKGAKQLIEVLVELMGDEQKQITTSHENEAYRLNNLG